MQALLRMASLAAISVSLAGCPRPPDFPANYRVLLEEPNGANAVSRGALLVADNQQQYLYGKPVWMRTPLADRFVGTAIRAPQLDLFGPSVLSWILDNHSTNSPTIHLGDGLNLSCRSEYERFVAIMSRARAGWFMAPGNHDGIYFGSSDSAAEWRAVCDGDAPITQATFVERYVSEVLAGRRIGAPAVVPSPDVGAQRFALEFTERRKGGSWEYPNADAACRTVVPGRISCPVLTRIAWRVDDKTPHRSYVVQELTMTRPGRPTPVKYILLDTSNYVNAPTLLPNSRNVNAGMTGDLTKEQLEIVEGWLEKNAPPGKTGAPYIVFMGHHPFKSLTSTVQSALDELRRRFGVLLYVSAHTHHGAYFVNGPENSSWVELNVGSTVDWPLEYRDFRLVENAEQVPYSSSVLFEIGRDWTAQDASQCDPKWQPQRADHDYYIDYTKHLALNADQTRLLIFRSLLASYKRLLENVPSSPANQVWPRGAQARSDAEIIRLIDATSGSGSADAARDLLKALEDFDASRDLLVLPGTGPDAARTRHRDYRLCQALWASQDDHGGARKARREDWYVSFPERM